MIDLAKGELSPGGQIFLLLSAGLFLIAFGSWFLVNAKRPEAVNRIRSFSGFSPRGAKETQILARIVGSGLTIGGVIAMIGGIVVALL